MWLHRTGAFQSAPSPRAGRYVKCACAHVSLFPVSIRSQPEGREILGFLYAVFRDGLVSIRSQPEGREIPRHIPSSCLIFCVSIRSQPEGREILYIDITLAAGITSFNPLPARGPGDTRSEMERTAAFSRFQSAPSPRAGRYDIPALQERVLEVFQSAPSPRAGRYTQGEHNMKKITMFQSAPSPRAGRYGDRHWLGLLYVRSFNPLPARGPGDTVLMSRHCNPGCLFQSAPSPRAGRYTSPDL